MRNNILKTICVLISVFLFFVMAVGSGGTSSSYNPTPNNQASTTPSTTKEDRCQGHHDYDYSNPTKEVYPTTETRGYRIYKCRNCETTKNVELYSFKEIVDVYIEELANSIRETLVDPDSMQYKGKVFLYNPYDSPSEYENYGCFFGIEFSYNAKNRLGGYVGYKTEFRELRNNGGWSWYPEVSSYSDNRNRYSLSRITGVDVFGKKPYYKLLYSFSSQ